MSVAMFSVVIAATWQMSGYTMAMFLAGCAEFLKSCVRPRALTVRTNIKCIVIIVIPMLRPITLSAVNRPGHISLKIFDMVVSMTGPGPAFATDVPAFFMWDTTFRGNNFAQGAAIATILLVSVAVLIVPIW